MNTSPNNSVFQCRGIVKNYEGEAVVSGINFDLFEGEIISLVGPSGVGKTTLFNVLAGVDRPDEGQIFLDGNEITGDAGKVSYMMQKDLLLEYRTVLDNVILPLLVCGAPKQKAREFAASFFESFGLAGYEKKYPFQLSGGMKQRAALLRTCLQNKQIILLDEPFSALDALTRRSMQDWFQNIINHSPIEKRRLSAVFITHDVEEAIFLSARIYVLNGKPGTISKIFEVPAGKQLNRDFSLTQEFAALKKAILDAVEG